MRTETRKVYFCEFCKKHSLSAGWISRHEKHCQNRLENRHKCFQECTHLKRKVELIDYDKYGMRGKTVFTCGVTGVNMYSYLLEKRMDFKPEFIKGLIRMPIECKDHKYMTEAELQERFHIEI